MIFPVKITPTIHQLTLNPRLGFSLLGFTKPVRSELKHHNRLFPLCFPHFPRDSIGGTSIWELFRRVPWRRSLIKWYSEPLSSRMSSKLSIRALSLLFFSLYVRFCLVRDYLSLIFYWFCALDVFLTEIDSSLLVLICMNQYYDEMSRLLNLSFQCMSSRFNFSFDYLTFNFIISCFVFGFV